MIYLRWICYLPCQWILTFLCWWTNPIACLFVTRKNGRDDLWGWFYLWQTFDNHVDEYWYGGYHDGQYTTNQYKNSRWVRYKYRVLWLKRNTAYGFSYKLLSIPKGTGFQFKGQAKIPFWFFGKTINDYNLGWKAHKGFDRLNFAGRIIGLR